MVWCSSGGACDFYPRSPCGERRFVTAFRGSVDNFYPRSPCGERQHINSRADNVKRFLSTLSLRRATCPRLLKPLLFQISIHALLAESDPIWQRLRRPRGYFYPRSPCGERPVLLPAGRLSWRISIHALLAESDAEFFCVVYVLYISIHALLAESDPVPPPCGIPDRISIHALLAESDHPQTSNHPHNTDFYPRSPCGERQLTV